MTMFTTPSQHSRFYKHIKILSNRLYNLPSLDTVALSLHSLSVCIYSCLPLFRLSVATQRAFVQRIPTKIYHEDSETRRKGGPGTQ